MTFRRALAYFFREALVSLVRSWKVSFVAVTTIGVSLFVGGVFLVVGENLARVAEQAREDVRVVVYMEPGASAEQMASVARAAERLPWVRGAAAVTAAQARERFVQIFPGLGELLERDADALPPSVEIGIRPDAAPSEGYESWLQTLRETPLVSTVDDDQEWIGQLGAAVAVVRGLGLALGAILLAAAVFTIGSVIRLTAYLYEEEITIMRLVGATEFYIRGPFYAEGLLQGLIGGGVAAGGLWLAFRAVATRLTGSLLGALALVEVPSVEDLALLVGLGTAAGLVGAVVSLRGESLGEPPVDEV